MTSIAPQSSQTINVPNQIFHGDITKLTPTVENGKPKGRNVSNRPWKVRSQKRASSLITKCPLNARSKSWEQKQAERAAKRAVSQREAELKEETRRKKVEKRERRLEQEKRRMENEYKEAQRSAQVMRKNVALKMKAMNKKQLRQIKKTRMNARTGVVEYVSAYAK